VIIGTAGHIDHGKTTLVRSLTGVDTDRLKEEKARGISIELGYAYAELDGGTSLGFIDVPGHERLVHTMLAGACGIDYALIVVAADDGVMPQTREHVAILDLLGVSNGVVALTKADRVSSDRLAAVESDVLWLLAGTGLADLPRYAVNATDSADPGVIALGTAIRAAAGRVPVRSHRGLFRLAIDRAFSIAGHGTVVTGTVFGGRVTVGEQLSLLPAATPVRVRAIRAHNSAADAGQAGDRCAVNVSGVDPSEVSRGDWLADPRGLVTTERIDARLKLLADERPLSGYAPVHVHYGATHVTAHVLLLDAERLAGGSSGLVQLVLDRAVSAAVGDRFVIRNAQADRTIGGGIFLDPEAPTRRRRSTERRQILAAREELIASGDLAPLIAAAPWGLTGAEITRVTHAPLEMLEPLAGVRVIAAAKNDDCRIWIDATRCEFQAQRACASLAEFHRAHPAEPGPDPGRLRRIAAPNAPPRAWEALIEQLVAADRVRRNGAWLQLPAHALQLSAQERVDSERIAEQLAARRFSPPWVRDLAVELHEPERRIRQLLAGLGRDGRAYQIVPDLYFERDAVAELARVVERLVAEHGAVQAAAFRDAATLGRKRAIQILEFFDRVGYTRRVGDSHVLRSTGGWSGAR
jgi:selenocysteine-specific elongation factor